MRERIAQSDLLEEGSHDAFLVRAECPQPRRVSVGRTKRSHQRLDSHGGIVRTPERVVDQPRQIMAPRTGVEIAELPECESFEVRISRLVRCGIERHRLVVAVHVVGATQRQRGEGPWCRLGNTSNARVTVDAVLMLMGPGARDVIASAARSPIGLVLRNAALAIDCASVGCSSNQRADRVSRCYHPAGLGGAIGDMAARHPPSAAETVGGLLQE